MPTDPADLTDLFMEKSFGRVAQRCKVLRLPFSVGRVGKVGSEHVEHAQFSCASVPVGCVQQVQYANGLHIRSPPLNHMLLQRIFIHVARMGPAALSCFYCSNTSNSPMDSTQRRAAMAERPDYLRSRVTNGSALLPNVDGRSLWIRRLRDVMSAHIADLGGDDAISEAERSIVRRVGTLTVAIEQIEARFAQEGEASERALDLHQRMAGNLRRLLESLGMKRRARDITPSLDQYLGGQR